MGNKFLKSSKFWSVYLPLLLILIVAAMVRLLWLDRSPPSLNWDETALGYNAYSLLTTGKDEYGHKLPFLLRSFDDYKPALYAYLAVPFIKIFGLSETAVRLPSAISGIVVVLSTYLLGKHFFSRRAGLFAALLVAISPWAIHFSRVAFEANLALAMMLVGIYAGLKSKHKPYLMFLSILLLTLSAYTYHANKVLFLPIILGLIWTNQDSLPKTKGYRAGLAFFIFILLIPLVWIALNGQGTARLASTSIVRLWNLENVSIFSAVNNPVYMFGKDLVGRYFAYFSPVNIFVRGTNESTQKVAGFGAMHTIEFIFWIAGFIFFVKNKFKPRFFLFLLLIAPLPAVVTWNWFVHVRVLLLFVLFAILAGYGIDSMAKVLSKTNKYLRWLLYISISVVLINSFAMLMTSIMFFIPYQERGNWQYGFREIMAEVAPLQDQYDTIYFEIGHAQPHIFTLFYGGYPPARYHADLGSPDAVAEPRKNFDFGNYVFRNIYWPDDRGLTNSLFIGSTYSLPEQDIDSTDNAKILKDVYDKNGEFVARIVEIQ